MPSDAGPPDAGPRDLGVTGPAPVDPGAVVDQLRRSLERNVATVHGPLEPSAAVALTVERCGELRGGAPVALADGDVVVRALEVRSALEAGGIDVVAPDRTDRTDPADRADRADWADAVARAGVGVTGALAAAAEIGTVAVGCGPGAPRAVSLLPDAHVCLLPVVAVRSTFEDALTAVLEVGLPGYLAWVSGPSRSADIEKRITLGVHGPRTFEVILVDGP